LVNEIYKKDDFILINRNVYNLSPSTLNNTLIFDAIEDNKKLKINFFYEEKYKEINNIILELVNKKFFEIDFN
jgi:hypothetical protein